MDISFSYLGSEEESRRAIKQYSRDSLREFLFYLLLVLLLCWGIFSTIDIKSAVFYFLVVLVLFFFLPYLRYRLIWNSYRALLKRQGSFEYPIIFHLTGESMEMTHRENYSKIIYKDVVTGFIVRKELLILLCNRTPLAFFRLKQFSKQSDYDDFIALFRNGNFEDKTHISNRLYLEGVIFLIIFSMILWVRLS